MNCLLRVCLSFRSGARSRHPPSDSLLLLGSLPIVIVDGANMRNWA